jgi:ADP-ribosyl-[dinitrogen reductase] hydrolase
MLVELAIGDAYGAGFEYSPDGFVAEHNTLAGYVEHPRHRGIAPGNYTDDTQMTLAIAELLVSGEAWTVDNLADRFVSCYHRDPRDGYSSGFHALLRAHRTGAGLRAALNPASDRSGAAMRTTPVGLLPDIEHVLRATETQARITHDTAAGVESAQAAALAVHYCHHRVGPTGELAAWVEHQLRRRGGREEWARPWRGKVGGQGVMSARAAITALSAASGLAELLLACIAFTGDVDTVATIALAAGSRAADIAQDLPRQLYDTLENGRYGRDHLTALDTQLLRAFS